MPGPWLGRLGGWLVGHGCQDVLHLCWHILKGRQAWWQSCVFFWPKKHFCTRRQVIGKNRAVTRLNQLASFRSSLEEASEKSGHIISKPFQVDLAVLADVPIVLSRPHCGQCDCRPAGLLQPWHGSNCMKARGRWAKH